MKTSKDIGTVIYADGAKARLLYRILFPYEPYYVFCPTKRELTFHYEGDK